MKFLSILAAVSLALAPAIASADSHEDSNDDKSLTPGPVAGHVAIVGAGIPVEGAAIGVLVLIGAAAVALIGGDDAAVDTIPTTNGT
ncbi:MAG: hypothetical protein V3R90_05295 [Limibaculum sp.]